MKKVKKFQSQKEENLAKSPKDVICQLLPLGCIRYCACAVSNICSQRLISENVELFEENWEKIFKRIVSDFINGKEVEEIEVEEEIVAKEPGRELSGGNLKCLWFVLIVPKFRKFQSSEYKEKDIGLYNKSQAGKVEFIHLDQEDPTQG